MYPSDVAFTSGTFLPFSELPCLHLNLTFTSPRRSCLILVLRHLLCNFISLGSRNNLPSPSSLRTTAQHLYQHSSQPRRCASTDILRACPSASAPVVTPSHRDCSFDSVLTMASQPELSDDAEVQRLLSELKQYTPNIPIANLDQPAPVVQKLWGDLHFAWWRATVQRLSQSSEDSPVPNWAKWIQAHTTPACLDVALHWVFGEQWMNIGASGAKENPYSRIATVAKRLGLDPASHSTPWLLFLFLGTDVLSSPKCMKTISAFIGHQPASFDPNVLLCAINDKAVRRHGLDNIHSAPQVRRKDVIRTISGK